MAEINLQSLDDTRQLGMILGRISKPGDVIFLVGMLGAGKTTLTQFIAEGLGVPKEHYVTSPSFALLQQYPGRISLYHIDCYRLEDEDDVEESGLMDYIVADGLSVVEWPERLGSLAPAERLDLIIRPAGSSSRIVEFIAHGKGWQGRISEVIEAFTHKTFDKD